MPGILAGSLQIAMRLSSESRDGVMICVAGFLRSATIGLTGVVLAIHLASIGLSAASIGIVVGAGLAGTAVATLLVSVRADGWGRKRTLLVLTLLAAIGYLGLSRASRAGPLVAIAFAGMLNGMGRDRGAASSLDQAIAAGHDGR